MIHNVGINHPRIKADQLSSFHQICKVQSSDLLARAGWTQISSFYLSVRPRILNYIDVTSLIWPTTDWLVFKNVSSCKVTVNCEQLWTVLTTRAACSTGPYFVTWSEYRLPWLRFSGVSFSSSRQMLGYHLKRMHDCGYPCRYSNRGLPGR
jgi:hypothetical protein